MLKKMCFLTALIFIFLTNVTYGAVITEKEYNGSEEKANRFEVGDTVKGTINHISLENEVDYFTTVLPHSGIVTVSASVYPSDCKIQVGILGFHPKYISSVGTVVSDSGRPLNFSFSAPGQKTGYVYVRLYSTAGAVSGSNWSVIQCIANGPYYYLKPFPDKPTDVPSSYDGKPILPPIQYQFSVALQALPDQYEPNYNNHPSYDSNLSLDQMLQKGIIKTISIGQEITAYLFNDYPQVMRGTKGYENLAYPGGENDTDIYHIYLSQPDTVKVTLRDFPQNANSRINITDSSGSWDESKTGATYFERKITKPVNVFIKISQGRGQGNLVYSTTPYKMLVTTGAGTVITPQPYQPPVVTSQPAAAVVWDKLKLSTTDVAASKRSDKRIDFYPKIRAMTYRLTVYYEPGYRNDPGPTLLITFDSDWNRSPDINSDGVVNNEDFIESILPIADVSTARGSKYRGEGNVYLKDFQFIIARDGMVLKTVTGNFGVVSNALKWADFGYDSDRGRILKVDAPGNYTVSYYHPKLGRATIATFTLSESGIAAQQTTPIDKPNLPPYPSQQEEDKAKILASVPTIMWRTNAPDLRGKNRQQFTYLCPPNGSPHTVWGTDVYTDDSSICTAAVHAGLITFQAGGYVTIEIRPGQLSYTGSARNGVTSKGYSAWYGSFIFIGQISTQPYQPPITIQRELINNGALKTLQNWTIHEWYKPSDGNGEVIVESDGIRFKSLSGNNRIGIMQTINADVSSCSSLVLSAVVKADHQTLTGTGWQGRESPVALFMSYTDVNGVVHNLLSENPNDTARRMFWHGFYYADPTPPSLTVFGTKVSRSSWHTHTVDLAALNPRPKFIQFIGAEGAGWASRDGKIGSMSLKCGGALPQVQQPLVIAKPPQPYQPPVAIQPPIKTEPPAAQQSYYTKSQNVEIFNITTAKNVAFGQPVGITNIFLPTDNPIFIYFKFNGIGIGSEIKTVWYYLETESPLVIGEASVTVKKTADYANFDMELEKGKHWPKGRYKIDILVNGVKSAESFFAVIFRGGDEFIKGDYYERK